MAGEAFAFKDRTHRGKALGTDVKRDDCRGKGSKGFYFFELRRGYDEIIKVNTAALFLFLNLPTIAVLFIFLGPGDSAPVVGAGDWQKLVMVGD